MFNGMMVSVVEFILFFLLTW